MEWIKPQDKLPLAGVYLYLVLNPLCLGNHTNCYVELGQFVIHEGQGYFLSIFGNKYLFYQRCSDKRCCSDCEILYTDGNYEISYWAAIPYVEPPIPCEECNKEQKVDK